MHYPDPSWLSSDRLTPWPGDPHKRYAALRAAGTIHRAFIVPRVPGWLVVSYRLAREALNHPALTMRPPDSPEDGPRGYPFACDPPEHTRLRGLISGVVTPQRAQRLAPRMRAIAVELLDAVRGLRNVDIALCYVEPLTALVLCEFLGVERERQADFRRWAFQSFNAASGTGGALAKLRGLLAEMIAEKRRRPADDLLSDLLAGRDHGGGRPDEEESLDIALTVCAAIYVHTCELLIDTVRVLLRHPEQIRGMRDRPELLPRAVEEVLRYASPPGPGPLRFAAEDLVLGGATVRRGDMISISIASAGRDAPVCGPEPAVFDLTRPDVRHLAFGDGPHKCPGAPLVRLMVSIAMVTLFIRHPRLASADPPTGSPMGPSGGHRSLRVRLNPGAS
ncbi:cytochrome P450 [Thermopolyspora sp. NPDC052614]|uniref:cytochrome P450 n=1 Tax=Thermopolyspora sp. NPDC052614 TaxID=3155682 RepID=UPI003435D2CB